MVRHIIAKFLDRTPDFRMRYWTAGFLWNIFTPLKQKNHKTEAEKID
jgi:hypothetical protein